MFFSDMENRYIEPPTELPTPELVMSTPASSTSTRSSLPHTTARSSPLQELQKLWLEIGESDNERTKMTLELEKECLDIYNKKVEETRKYKAELQRLLAEDEAEIASLISALGEQISFSWKVGPLKHRISTLKPVLEDLRMKKVLRWKIFSETLTQIAEISSNIAGNDYPCSSGDLTQTMLDGLKAYVQYLHNDKAVRLQKVNSYISVVHELSDIMSFDLSEALTKVHESLTGCSKNISDDTLTGLTELVESRKKEKHQRLLQLQGLLRTMHELWELLETPMDERIRFGHLGSLLSQAADDVLEKGWLGLDILREAEAEVKKLNALNESQDKMKELAVSETATQHLPRERVLPPVEQVGSPDTQGSSSNVGDSDAVKAESFIQQVLLQIEGRKRDTSSEVSIVLYDRLSRLFQSYYTLPEMEKEFRATYTTYDPRVKLPGQCFKLFVESIDGADGAEGGGAAAYLRRSLDFSRQRKEAEERRIREEEIEQRLVCGSAAGTSGYAHTPEEAEEEI